MALGLAVVIALLLVTLWVLKRVAAPRGAAAGMKILGAAAVGPREKVVLVEIGETVLVLGVAPGQVTPLHSLATSDLPGPGPAPAAAPSAAFQAQLRQLLERRK
ncbi:MAG: flagellar biosynthetic protein FliO [Zoogloeaceae bacterium]|nr:flagellar biosynthetic protein FliO [Zoogloeaceae bacterium]